MCKHIVRKERGGERVNKAGIEKGEVHISKGIEDEKNSHNPTPFSLSP